MIIDLNSEREKRDGPDAEFVFRDDMGVKWSTFSISYQTENGEFSVHIWATSMEDAEARVAALRETAKLDGQVYHQVYL
jgi:hypothetical protein